MAVDGLVQDGKVAVHRLGVEWRRLRTRHLRDVVAEIIHAIVEEIERRRRGRREPAGIGVGARRRQVAEAFDRGRAVLRVERGAQDLLLVELAEVRRICEVEGVRRRAIDAAGPK